MPMEQTTVEIAVPEKGLTYLFTVLYHDRSTFQQNADDVSAIDPQKSAFTDATHRIVNGKFLTDGEGKLVSRIEDVWRFMLMAQDGSDHSYMVDMQTGHFEINCVPFRIHDQEVQYFNRRLIFGRRHYHEILCRRDGTKEKGAHRVVYRLGWQANLQNGKNVQYVMEID